MDGTDDDVRVTIVAHVESDDVRSSSQGSDRGGNAGLDVGDEERNTESGSNRQAHAMHRGLRERRQLIDDDAIGLLDGLYRTRERRVSRITGRAALPKAYIPLPLLLWTAGGTRLCVPAAQPLYIVILGGAALKHAVTIRARW